MAFALFILLTANLFLRPAELVPALYGMPLYEWTILATVLVSLPAIANRFRPELLQRDPVSLCVLGLLVAVPLSHLSHLFLWGARHSAEEFSKTVVYYVVMVSVVNSVRRLEQFYTMLLVLLVAMTSLSLAHRSGAIELPQLDSIEQREFDAETGQVVSFARMQSTGLFSDPNDFAMILVVGILLCLHRTGRASIPIKPLWLSCIGLFGFALALTCSRGGLLALFAGGVVLAHARWGTRRAVIASLLLAPVVLVGFAARGNAFDSGTGQSRVQLWAEGFSLLKQSPIFGIGHDMFVEEVLHVAHNSFVHCYTELGLFGGTLFFGAFYFAITTLWRQRLSPRFGTDVEFRRRTVTTTAVTVAAATSMLSLSRSYVVPTYLVLGLAAATIRLNGAVAPASMPRLSPRAVGRLAVASCCCLVATYMFTRVMVRWG